MTRWLLVFLLVLVPLQTVWGVAGWHHDPAGALAPAARLEGGNAAERRPQAPGAERQEHPRPAADTHGCGACHLVAVAPAAADLSPAPTAVSTLWNDAATPPLPSGFHTSIDRPKWTPHRHPGAAP